MSDLDNRPKFLVVCRVKNCAHAPAWAFSNDDYDCALSQYGEDADPHQHYFPGGKWIGIFNLFQRNPDFLENYDYFWFPDDDIEATLGQVVDFLKICATNRFELAQPALTRQSYYAYRITLANPRFQFRLTNFVELMMPLIKKNLLKKLLPFFESRHAALGIDWMWHKLADEPDSRVAIIDKVAMGHYRPRNQFLAGRMKKIHNIDIHEERQRTLKDLKIIPHKPRIHKGRLLNGSDISGIYLGYEVVCGYFSVRKQIRQKRWSLKNYHDLFVESLHIGSKN